MSRFTVTDLRSGIDEINGWLADAGASVRFIYWPRNGYQAVDEFNVDADGSRIGSGVNRMVGSGTSRETYDEAHTAYQHVMSKIRRDKTDDRIEELRRENKRLRKAAKTAS